MKISLDGILVVEGKEDSSYLSNYISSEIVVLNGFEMDKHTIYYLKNKRVIALLDPDESGKQIRQKLNNLLDNVVNVEIDINKCTRGSKNGIAECEINTIINVLSPYIKEKEDRTNAINESDLYSLELIGNRHKRSYVCEYFNLGKCNAKLLYKRLLLNNVKYEQLVEALKDYNDN